MAEISYPFAAASAGGGSPLVSQIQWQSMAKGFGNDRIDFRLVNTNYTEAEIPFLTTTPGTGVLTVRPGNAFVGGFYYQLTASTTLTLDANSGSQGRIDLVVIRADLAAGSVNLGIVKGQPSANPVEPAPTRVAGGKWEMVLYACSVPASGGTVTLSSRRKVDIPSPVSVALNAEGIADGLQQGSFVLDLDVNDDTGGQTEGFKGRDGYTVTRHLGKRRPFTPDLFTVDNKPAAGDRFGYWRWIAPGTVSFSLEIHTQVHSALVTGGITSMCLSLPKPASAETLQVFSGCVTNPRKSNSMPNFMAITARTAANSTTCALYFPSLSSISEGLDSFARLPAYSVLYLSGVYEANTLN